MSDKSALRLGVFMAAAGTTHFLAPWPYDKIVPPQLPGRPRTWTHLSGLAELACAAAVLNPGTRRLGALATAGLFMAVFPANVKMARDWRERALPLRAAAYGRLPMQAPLVAWALQVARSAD